MNKRLGSFLICLDIDYFIIGSIFLSQAAGLLICKACGPLTEMGLMEFLFCIHKTDLALNSVDRANRANRTNETKYELLSHECVRINRYW